MFEKEQYTMQQEKTFTAPVRYGLSVTEAGNSLTRMSKRPQQHACLLSWKRRKTHWKNNTNQGDFMPCLKSN